MAQFASGSFTGADGTELSAHDAAWTRHTSYTGNSQLASNRLRQTSATTSAYWHSGAPVNADYSVSADIFAKETNGGACFTGVMGRVNTAANTFYMARYAGDITDGWQLYKAVAGVFTQLGSTATQSLTDETAYNLKLEMIGSAIKLYKEGSGTATISATDSSITAPGKAGVRLGSGGTVDDNSGVQLDNFSADDIGSTPTVIDLTAASLNTTAESPQLTLVNNQDIASFNTTAESPQLALVNNQAVATFDFVAQDITAENASTATITLDTATFGFVANDAQNTVAGALDVATFDFVQNDVQALLAHSLDIATFDFVQNDAQFAVSVLLSEATFNFTANSITFPGLPSTGRATSMMLMGVGN